MSLFAFKISLSDSPVTWQIGFQDPATPVMEGIINLHHEIMGYLIFILIFVVYMLARTVMLFPETNISVGQLPHSTTLEIVWTVIPFYILVLIAIPSFALLYSLDEIPTPQLTITVVGRQWYWTYEYPDHEKTLIFDSYMVPEDELKIGQHRLLEVDNRIVLPTETHIRLLITAGDVIHSWAVPSLGIKMDAIPGRLNQVFLYIKREGVFYGQCSELCGVNHAFMPIVVEALSPLHFNTWFSHRYYEEFGELPKRKQF